MAKLAGQVYLRFKELPQAHPSDLGELAFHVHAIGRIVFARAAIRAHPEHWTVQVAARSASACSARPRPSRGVSRPARPPTP